MELRDKYNTLVCYILDNGQKFPKKHGNWVKLNLFKDYYLSLDTWNGYISFCKGRGEYNEWLGFGNLGFCESEKRNCDKRICFLGGFINNNVDPKPEREETLDWILFEVLDIKI